jgi:hypothetical protein
VISMGILRLALGVLAATGRQAPASEIVGLLTIRAQSGNELLVWTGTTRFHVAV